MPGPAKQPCYCVTCNGALMSNRTFRRHLSRPQVSRYDNSLVKESGESDSDNSDLDEIQELENVIDNALEHDAVNNFDAVAANDNQHVGSLNADKEERDHKNNRDSEPDFDDPATTTIQEDQMKLVERAEMNDNHDANHPLPSQRIYIDHISDPDLRLSRDLFMACSNDASSSERTYKAIRESILRRYPDVDVLTYRKIKKNIVAD